MRSPAPTTIRLTLLSLASILSLATSCSEKQATAQPRAEVEQPRAAEALAASSPEASSPTARGEDGEVVKEVAAIAEVKPEPTREELEARYVWLKGRDDLGDLTTLDRRFSPPEGFARVEVAEGSYQEYLRGLPMRTDRTSVKLYNGESVSMPSAAIVPLDLGKRDLHQCADSVIRLYSEWLWSQDRAMEAQFHYTSGDLARWKDWRNGKVLRIKKGKVVQVKAKAAPNTHAAYRKWLDRVFMYASTRSMHRDSVRIKESAKLRAGDFFLMGGSPGHVVLLLDVAENAEGARVALVGQGYLPAREFHVIEGDSASARDTVWFKLPGSEGATQLNTPTWRPFELEHAWRFR